MKIEIEKVATLTLRDLVWGDYFRCTDSPDHLFMLVEPAEGTQLEAHQRCIINMRHCKLMIWGCDIKVIKVLIKEINGKEI